MVIRFKWYFFRLLTPIRQVILLLICSYLPPGFSAAAIPDISLVSEQKNFILLTLSLLLIFLLVRYRKSRYGLLSRTGKQYTYLEISKSKQQIGLYRLHQNNTGTVLNISDVCSSKILLNGKLINLITQEQADTFDADREKQLLTTFARIQREKMHNGQQRKVNLVLTDKQHKNYIICLYLRSGNRRLTKTRYQDVVEDIVDWCRLLSSQINRYHQQPQTPAVKTLPAKETSKPQAKQEQEQQEQSDNDEFIASLERLVTLKQQGLLSEHEFTRAKDKLLRKAKP